MLKVVAALIEQDDKVFMAQRLKGKYEDMWEFPGGKVEPGETDIEAIEREIMKSLILTLKLKNL